MRHRLIGFDKLAALLGIKAGADFDVVHREPGPHVPLNELTELDTRVILARYEIYRVVRRSDLQNDFRIGAGKLSQLWQQHHLRRRSWNDDPNSAGRVLPLLPGFGDRLLNPLQGRRKFVEQCCAGGGWRNASCGPRQQL